MAENTDRGLFKLHGITGMLIATVLLLSILVGLESWAIHVERAESTHFYNPAPIWNSLNNIKETSKENAKFSSPDVKK